MSTVSVQFGAFVGAVYKLFIEDFDDEHIKRELIERIDVYYVEGSGKNKAQRIVIHYRFVSCLTIPEWYKNVK